MTADTRTFEQRLKDAGLLNTEAPGIGPTIQTVAAGDTSNRYLARAVADEAAKVRNAAVGKRNSTLNIAAFNLGQLVTGAGLDRALVVAELTAAALAVGLASKETDATIESGLEGGSKEPRGVPELREVHTAPTLTAFDPATPIPDDVLLAHVLEHFPRIDWHALWEDEEEEEWIIEPLLPARRLIALYSAPKVGKSLLMLELAAAIATGREVLGVTPQPRNVLYVDFENDPKADIRERLQAMGYGPDDLDRLCYLSFPTIAALDSPRGGAELLAAVRGYACELVVIDTVSRAVAGEENENDTWLAFYRHTGLALKKAQVALVRLDHSGKDETKGQRGGSAKSGDVDAIWRLSKVTDTTFRLDCDGARMRVGEQTLVIHREATPLRHKVDASGRNAAWQMKIASAVEALDAASVPVTAGRDTARGALKEVGFKAGHDVVKAAQELRRSRGRQTDWMEG